MADEESMHADTVAVVCPSCGEAFEVVCPPAAELPAELDYDCEICCRPMVIAIGEEDGRVEWSARGLDE